MDANRILTTHVGSLIRVDAGDIRCARSDDHRIFCEHLHEPNISLVYDLY